MGTKLGSADLADMHRWLHRQWHPPAERKAPGVNGAAAAQPRSQPAGPTAATVTVPARPAVALGGPAGSLSVYRVEEPDRLLRVWGMLSAASDELHKAALPPKVVARLQRQLRTAIAELERAVSPALADELDSLTRQDGTIPATTGELRVEYASLLGWASGLVIAMLDQLYQGNAGAIGQDSAASELTMPIVVKLSARMRQAQLRSR